MKKRVICRVCGYVMEAGKVKDKCPACGAPAKAFQDYAPVMAARRELWLSFDIHPVLVHFPVAFSVTTFLLAVLFAFAGEALRRTLGDTVLVASVLLPFTVAAGAVSGLLDGKVRFKKINTPLLVKKIVLGVLFFAASAGMILVALLAGLESTAARLAFLAFNAGAIACAVFLGLIGKTLVCARTPG